MTEQSQKRPITVTHIISGDLWAGAEVQVYNLCKALNNSDEVAVTAVVFNPGILHDKLVELGIPVTLADESSTGPMGIAKAIASHCRSQGTDIVHTHGFKENVLGIFGKELARVRYSVRTVHGNPEHAFSLKAPQKWLISKLDIWLGRTRQQTIIAVSSQLENNLDRLFPHKVQKIYNFIDVKEVRKTWAPMPRQESSKLKLGIVGRLVPVKRVDIFIRIIANLTESGVQCEGIIIGDGPLLPELRILADNLGISESIKFKGFINPAVAEVNQLDALVMPSDHEGLPMTLLEAVALGLPIFAHCVGGIPEVLRSYDNGFLIKTHTPEGYSSAILKHAGGKPYFQRTTPNESFMQSFSSAPNAKNYIKVYENLAHA